jgi:hypothetical protein
MTNKCTVRDGLFVEPCETLEKAIDNNIPGFSKVKGIFIQHLINLETGKPSRSYVGLKSSDFKSGILFYFCPFCGGDISAPFQYKEKEPTCVVS